MTEEQRPFVDNLKQLLLNPERLNMKEKKKHRATAIWDERYAGSDYIYGTEPNRYLKEQLATLPAGRILFAGEGEGRNAVYAAGQGWQVSAFDISREGRKKAMLLADQQGVQIDYRVGELHELDYETEPFDVIALIFTHFPEEERAKIHKRLSEHLRPGGIIILEAFSKNHIQNQASNPNAGGPKEHSMLITPEDLKNDFAGFEILELNETEIHLSEGSHHNGFSALVRFTGRK